MVAGTSATLSAHYPAGVGSVSVKGTTRATTRPGAGLSSTAEVEGTAALRVVWIVAPSDGLSM
ncbi:hypothetical protein SB754_11220 [Leifsonia sp. SIMBA_070]